MSILTIGFISWCLSWIILAFKFDLLTSIAFILYGLGISGLTMFITLDIIDLKKWK